MLFNIFWNHYTFVFQDFLTNRKCKSTGFTWNINNLFIFKFIFIIWSAILLPILRFINYFLNNLMYPCYIHFVLLIEKPVYLLNTIYQYVVRFILIIMYYLGDNQFFCRIHRGMFKVVFSGHCRSLSLSRSVMQLCPPACPSPISVSVPTVVPTSECLAVTGVFLRLNVFSCACSAASCFFVGTNALVNVQWEHDG